ncbi:MAG TPA: succinylglutamate desuccinylase/aspartoacylase family protein [Advenella sp.]|nr:succinylglutamate desuccinylase/aspartoacylase family protein [Advenella sp.]
MSTKFEIAVPDLSAERLGNTDTPGVWSFDSGSAGPSVLITALIHGNEICGAWALKELLAAGVRPKKGRLVLAFCNLAAFDTLDVGAHDAARFVDEDMNRVWTGDKLGQPVTQERRRALELKKWVAAADWLLDIHSMHEPSPPLMMTGMLKRNVDLANRLGVPQRVIMDAGHKDGTRMRDFDQFGDPQASALALLIECGYHGDPSSVDTARNVVAHFLLASDIVDADDLPDHWVRTRKGPQTVLQVTAPVVARSESLSFSAAYQGMECIARAGTQIGQDGDKPIITPYDNCVLIMPSLRQLKVGVTVLRFARELQTVSPREATASHG